MENPFRVMVKLDNDIPISHIADEIELSRNTISKLVAKEMPRRMTLESYDKLAAFFGYQVKVELVKVNGDS